jgi:hypothetical protein
MKNPIKLTTDFLMKKLSNKGNSVGSIFKNAAICSSGIYYYHRSELASLGLDSIPEQYKNKTVFGVFRPPEVLENCKDMFARVPVTITHPDEPVTIDNTKEYAHGLTGDSVEVEKGEDGETYLTTTMTLFTNDAIKFYDKNKELSCGYYPVVDWKDGLYNGKSYELTMLDMKSSNHVALCKEARGGHTVRVLDSSSSDKIKPAGFNQQKETQMNLYFDIICKSKGAKDSADKFKMVLDSVKEQEKVKPALDYAGKLLSAVPASDEKTKLEEYIGELSTMDSLDEAQFKQCRDYLADLGYRLIKDSITPATPAADTKPAETPAAPAAAPTAPPQAPAAEDSMKVLATLIGDSVKTGIAEAFKVAGLAKDGEAPKPDKEVDDSDEEKKKKEEEAKKKAASDGMPTMSLTGDSASNTAIFTSDSIMNSLFGIKPKEDK